MMKASDDKIYKLYGLTKDKFTEIQQAFSKFDINGDGHITKEEVTAVFKDSGMEMTEQQAEDFIDTGDTNGDHQLSWDEFLKLLAKKMRISAIVTPELITELTNLTRDQFLQIQQAFRSFDANSDGKVTYHEVAMAFKAAGVDMSDDEAQDFVATGDTDGNEVLTWDEFIVLLARDLKGKLRKRLGIF